MAGIPAIKLAYAIDSTPVSYEAKEAAVRITINQGKIEAETKGLPKIHYQYYGGPKTLTYLPQALEEKIHTDLSQQNIPGLKDLEVILFLFHLPPSEAAAQSMVGLSEWVRRGLPRASDGKLLSTRVK